MSTLDQICLDINERRKNADNWRSIAESFNIDPATARLISHGYNPGNKIRKQLGLPEEATVSVVQGQIPTGTQAIHATLCDCGQYFISNHPRRTRCFLCSPYRGKS